jgi:CheY-like chemotaxis protein
LVADSFAISSAHRGKQVRPPLDASVLVVEDDKYVREGVMESLQESGYAVVGVGDGQQALEYLRNAAILPRLILLDLMMPIMDGMEFRRRQMSSPDFGHIPVVLFTADATGREKAASMALKGFLQKPVRLNVLLEVVERICGPGDDPLAG